MSRPVWLPPPGLREADDRLAVDPAAALPVLQRGWLEALTGISNPRSEQRSTCADCVMCGDVERSGSRLRFSPDVKCCSYVPHVASFLAGRALAGPGRASVLERIRRRAGVTPLGLGLGPDDLLRLVDHRAGFGTAAAVRCPHYAEATGGCSIWGSRNAVCSTWFCRHDRGAVGQRFWVAVRDLLVALEERTARHCLETADLPAGQVEAVLAHRETVRAAVARANSGDGFGPGDVWAETDDLHAAQWGAWAGREEEWFVRCARTANALGGEALAALVADLPHLTEAVLARWAELGRRDLPDRLELTVGGGSEATTDVLRLVGYSPFDPVVLPTALEPALLLLDGRPVADALRAADGHPLPLDVDLLGRLHDFEVASEPT